MKTVMLLIVFCAACFSDDSQRPACNGKTRGQFWPAQANESREAFGKIVHQGDLEVCTYGTLRYKWVKMNLDARLLRKDAPAPAANLEIEKSNAPQQ